MKPRAISAAFVFAVRAAVVSLLATPVFGAHTPLQGGPAGDDRAAVRAVVETYPRSRFTDYLSLVRIAGTWQIDGLSVSEC